MKLHQVMIVAVLTTTVFASESFAQQRMFGNGRFLRRIMGQSESETKPKPKPTAAKSKSKSSAPTPAKKPAAPSRAETTKPTSPRSVYSPARGNGPTRANSVNSEKPTTPSGDTYVPATRSGKKQNLAFGMMLQDKKDKIVLTQIDPKGNAKKLGLKVGDEVIKAAGVKLNSVDDFNQVTSVLRPGDQIEVEFSRRGNKSKELLMFGDSPISQADLADMTAPADLIVPANRVPRSNSDFVPPQANNSQANRYRQQVQPPRQPQNAAERREFERAVEQQRLQIQSLNEELRQLRSAVPTPTTGSGAKSVLQVPDLNGPGR